MLPEETALQLLSVLSSLGLIYFIYYYFSQIHGFSINPQKDTQKTLSSHENSDLEEKLLKQEDNVALEKKDNSMELLNQFHEGISAENRLVFWYMSIFVAAFGALLFGMIAAFFEEYRGSFYISVAFGFGLTFSVVGHFICLEVGNVASFIMILKLKERVCDLYFFGFSTGIALISLFLGGVSLTLMGLIDVYRAYYIGPNQHKLKDYEKMMVLVVGGFSLGYFLAALFYRVGGSILQSSLNLTGDLIGKIDKGLPPDSLLNPCSLPSRVGELQSLFLQSFSDLSCLCLLIISSILIYMSEFTEFLTTRELLYYPLILLTSNIFVALLSYYTMSYFEFIANEDSPRFSRIQSLIQLLITSILSLVLLYQLTLTLLPTQFSLLADESLIKTMDKTQNIKNLIKINADPQTIAICVILGSLAEKIVGFSFEYLTASNRMPSQALLRACELGPCFNLVSANILTNLAYPLLISAIGALFMAGYGILGYFGLGLMGLGALGNIVAVFSIGMVGNLSVNAEKIAILAKMKETRREKLRNVGWYPQSYRGFLRGLLFLAVVLGGLSVAGNFACVKNDNGVMVLKTLQIGGLVFGFAIPHLLNGLIMNGAQLITGYAMRLAKIAMYNVHGLKDKSEQLSIDDLAVKSLIYVIIPNLTNFLCVYLLGFLFGSEIIFTYQIGFILSCSLLIAQSYLAGFALSNEKKFMENNAYIDKEGSVYASIIIGDTHSLFFKENSAGLIIYLAFNAMLCLVAEPHFDKFGRVAVALGLKQAV